MAFPVPLTIPNTGRFAHARLSPWPVVRASARPSGPSDAPRLMKVRLRQVPALTLTWPRARSAWLRRHPKRRPCGQVTVVACCGLTSHSSRCRFAARLNSGVRPLKSKAAWSCFNLRALRFARHLKLRLVRSRAVAFVTSCPGFGQARRPIGRTALGEGAASVGSWPEIFGAARTVIRSSAVPKAGLAGRTFPSHAAA